MLKGEIGGFLFLHWSSARGPESLAPCSSYGGGTGKKDDVPLSFASVFEGRLTKGKKGLGILPLSLGGDGETSLPLVTQDGGAYGVHRGGGEYQIEEINAGGGGGKDWRLVIMGSRMCPMSRR